MNIDLYYPQTHCDCYYQYTVLYNKTKLLEHLCVVDIKSIRPIPLCVSVKVIKEIELFSLIDIKCPDYLPDLSHAPLFSS